MKNAIHQIDNKNGWLLLSASFTAKLGLVYVLTLENAFSKWFYFQANRKSIGSLKNGTRDGMFLSHHVYTSRNVKELLLEAGAKSEV